MKDDESGIVGDLSFVNEKDYKNHLERKEIEINEQRYERGRDSTIGSHKKAKNVITKKFSTAIFVAGAALVIVSTTIGVGGTLGVQAWQNRPVRQEQLMINDIQQIEIERIRELFTANNINLNVTSGGFSANNNYKDLADRGIITTDDIYGAHLLFGSILSNRNHRNAETEKVIQAFSHLIPRGYRNWEDFLINAPVDGAVGFYSFPNPENKDIKFPDIAVWERYALRYLINQSDLTEARNLLEEHEWDVTKRGGR